MIKKKIMKTVNSNGIKCALRQLPLSCVTNNKVPQGQLEVWIDK